MWKEFKAFAFKGNVIDLAVGVIIGLAFGKIVTSVVNDLLMPIFGVISGGVNVAGLEYPFGDAVIKYGAFLQSIIDFFIIAFSVFIFVKVISQLKRKEEEKPEAAPEAPVLTKDQLLLEEIRDLLKKNR
jgi:large conductance mechanosensitive channel